MVLSGLICPTDQRHLLTYVDEAAPMQVLRARFAARNPNLRRFDELLARDPSPENSGM